MIHSDFKNVADSIASTSRSIDANGRLSEFLGELIVELSVALFMTQRELLLHVWELEDGSIN